MKLIDLLYKIQQEYSDTEIAELAQKFEYIDCDHCKHRKTFNASDSCEYYAGCDIYGEVNYFEPKD